MLIRRRQLNGRLNSSSSSSSSFSLLHFQRQNSTSTFDVAVVVVSQEKGDSVYLSFRWTVKMQKLTVIQSKRVCTETKGQNICYRTKNHNLKYKLNKNTADCSDFVA